MSWEKEENFYMVLVLVLLIVFLATSFAHAEEVVQIPRNEFAQFLGAYEKEKKICSLRSIQVRDLKQLNFAQAETIKKLEEIEKARKELAEIDDEYRRSLEAQNQNLKDQHEKDNWWFWGSVSGNIVLGAVVVYLIFLH